jgi:hypothetical protein
VNYRRNISTQKDRRAAHAAVAASPRMKIVTQFPSWEGARGVRPWGGWWNRNEPTPALRATPPVEGIFSEYLQFEEGRCLTL